MLKKLCTLVFLCLLAPWIASAAGEAAPVASEEELLALLADFRAQALTEFDVVFTEDCYAEIREGYFAKLDLIEVRAGIEKKSLRYSDGKYTLYFSAVEWIEPHVAECDTDEALREAIRAFLDAGVPEFRLICPEALSAELDKNHHIRAYMAQCGIEDFDLRDTFKYPRVYYISGMKA